jgi:hypothetical protein
MNDSNQKMREAWFRGFDAWQDKFNLMLKHCATSPGKAQAIGTTFLHDVMIPFMDAAKDRLLADIAMRVKSACEQAELLDRLVNRMNE